MEKQEAKKYLLEEGRFSIKPELAKEITEAFGLEFDESLVYTKTRYREQSNGLPRVSVSDLAKHICERLGKEPDEKTLETANRMNGEGSHRDLLSRAYAMNL